MKKILILSLLFSCCAFAENCHLEQVGGGDWRIVCEGSGLVFNYVDVTNYVYVVQDCENLKTSLLSSVLSINSDAESVYDERIPIEESLRDLTLEETIETNQVFITAYRNIYQSLEFIAAKLEGMMDNTSSSGASDNLYNQIYNISCASCPTNGASGGGSDGACCDVDFTAIIDRLIIAEQQRAAISNQIARISNYLGVVTNQLAYNNFLLEHGFNGATNLLDEVLYYRFDRDENLLLEYDNYWWYATEFLNNRRETSYYVEDDAGFIALFNAFYFNNFNALASLNNYNYKWQNLLFPSLANQLTNSVAIISQGVSLITNEFPIFAQDTTNLLESLRADINPIHSLAEWGGGSIYEYLTNQYLTAIDSSPSNWHSRVETLLAALVFNDSVAREKEMQDEIEEGLNDVQTRQSELEGAFDSEETISFLDLENFEKFEMPEIQSQDDQLPEFLVITFGELRWFNDSYAEQDITIDLTDTGLRDFLFLVRSFFRVMWWGFVLLFVWWLFKWFLRFIRWVWSAIKGVDFGS